MDTGAAGWADRPPPCESSWTAAGGSDTLGVSLDGLVERISVDASTPVPAAWQPPDGAGARVAVIHPTPVSGGPWSGGPPARTPAARVAVCLRGRDAGVDADSWLPSAAREELARW